ncbi:MAG: hypothetical protein K2J00_04690 [Bacteroidaceae bacterium]|nr:hypothetical protein [Bacteroidaceae bacterium]
MKEDKTTPEKDATKKSGLHSLMGSHHNDEATLRQWQSMWRQISIDGQWFRKQIGVILLAVCGIILYITCRYQAQQEIILEEQLTESLQDWKFRTLTRSSELTLKTRQSRIERVLREFGDTTLTAGTEAPITITAE